jgi:hypothetical protein
LSAPLDASYIRKLAKKTIAKVLRFYRVDPELKVNIHIGQLDNRSGQIKPQAEYLMADVTFDPSGNYLSAEDVYGTIVHEACHLVAARLVAEMDALLRLIPEDQSVYAAGVLNRANEELTERLARVYVGLHPLKEVVV